MSVLNPSVLTLLLATSISTLFGCAEDEKPEPTPFSLSCELTQIRPATIPLLTPTQVEVRAQCDVSEANIEAAKLAVAAATLRIEDTEHSELRMLLSDSGQLTASAIVTASKRRKRTFSIYEEGVSDLAEAIITGSLHVHDKEEDIVAEFGTPEPDACFVLCTGTDGVQSEAYVEGATCECASPTLISFADVPAEYYTWTEGSQLQIVRLDRVQGQDPVRTTLSVELATEPLPFTESQTLVTRNANEEPTLLWWGLSQAGAIVSVQIPLLSDGFGKSLLSNSTLFEATPAVFVSSMELWQQPEPAPPIPVFLFAHLEGKTEMAWSLVGLFSGVTGASLLTTTPLWGEVSPEEVMVGTAQAGFTRDGFDRNPQHGIDLTLHARAWSVRPDPANQSQVRITTYLGDGDGLTPEYAGVLPAPSSPQCWNLSPAPGGHLVSHHSLSADGAGGFYYASPDIDSTFGMAQILDLRGQNLFASSTTVSCEIGTPQSWDGISDPNTEGSVWA
ncbi:MAG: hypothetical protein JKY56_16925, partial [Kofleriaceae bacterium]|nr:hypothetical protein [Kofleriaceae bacterium]